jgi:hypothetical protein
LLVALPKKFVFDRTLNAFEPILGSACSLFQLRNFYLQLVQQILGNAQLDRILARRLVRTIAFRRRRFDGLMKQSKNCSPRLLDIVHDYAVSHDTPPTIRTNADG